jgi:hypothetical protein
MYKCGWNGCEKAYGTLNHLNAHVTMQSHGTKRTPEGMFPEFFFFFPLHFRLLPFGVVIDLYCFFCFDRFHFLLKWLVRHLHSLALLHGTGARSRGDSQ